MVAIDTGDVNDTKALNTLTKKVQDILEITEFDAIADTGYHAGKQIKACKADGITTYISPKSTSKKNRKGKFSVSDFTYDTKADTYTCPQGETLSSSGKWYSKTNNKNRTVYQMKQYKTKVCATCFIKENCTENKRGRVIERSEFQDDIDWNNNNVNTNKDYYRTRQQIIEHQFGTIKRQWHFDYLLLKGKEKVLAEVSIVFTAYNLRRCVSILGFDGLMSKLKAHFEPFLQVLLLCWLTKVVKRNKISAAVTTRSGPYVKNYYI